jgi:membrane protein
MNARLHRAFAVTRRLPGMLRRTTLKALQHDCFNLSQSSAYSAIVALFPAMVVIAAVIALLPDVAPLKVQVGEFFDEVLPSNAFSLLTSYFVSSPSSPHPHTIRSLFLAAIVSLSAGSSVIVTLMEGVRRAANLPEDCWKRFEKRKRALLLVPLSLFPLAIATVLVVFGRLLTEWAAEYLSSAVQPLFFALALAARWSISLAGVAGLTASIYRYGLPLRQAWERVVPGAIVATTMWFVSTLGFGWYVTRFANYSLIYGSLGAGIALLFWLYLVFLSVLCGAEFNAQFFAGDDGAQTTTSPRTDQPAAVQT